MPLWACLIGKYKIHSLRQEALNDKRNDRIMSACQEKCIPNNYHEPDLNKGEQKCIDRCVGKYMSIQGILGDRMRHLAPGYASTTNSDGFSPDRQQ